ncbi:MAG TPA: HU family DNA-binding protein [Jatrophihabitans sp.]|nr:HU family DNA-binding protein [Jatrophihabitans sp.]
MPNKAQFIEMLAERLDGDRKRAAAALDAVIDSVYATIARGEKVAITGFGVFERRDRAARTARNPATGATVNVAASRVPAFRPGAEFRAIANGAREFVERRSSDAQSVAGRVRGVQERAVAVVQDAVDAVLEVPGKAAAVVKKKGKKGRKKDTSAKQDAPAKKAAASKAAAKKAPVKKAAASKAPVKKAAASKAPAKKAAASKAVGKKAAAKKPATKTTSAKKK